MVAVGYPVAQTRLVAALRRLPANAVLGSVRASHCGMQLRMVPLTAEMECQLSFLFSNLLTR